MCSTVLENTLFKYFRLVSSILYGSMFFYQLKRNQMHVRFDPDGCGRTVLAGPNLPEASVTTLTL
jgi:hypothetical protein